MTQGNNADKLLHSFKCHSISSIFSEFAEEIFGHTFKTNVSKTLSFQQNLSQFWRQTKNSKPLSLTCSNPTKFLRKIYEWYESKRKSARTRYCLTLWLLRQKLPYCSLNLFCNCYFTYIVRCFKLFNHPLKLSQYYWWFGYLISSVNAERMNLLGPMSTCIELEVRPYWTKHDVHHLK